MKLIFLCASALLAADYQSSVDEWRREYTATLQAPDGWLSLAGLFWLHEGKNRAGSDPLSDIVLPKTAPKIAGWFELSNGHVAFQAAPDVRVLFDGKPGAQASMKSDTPGKPTVAAVGNIKMTFIQRGARSGIRVRDPESPSRRNFTGPHWFPVSKDYCVRAAWKAYSPPRALNIVNILGDSSTEKTPGYAEFQLHGKTWRLEPILEDNREDSRLFFMFKDQTSGKETYGSGRFLYTELPRDGQLTLDFNKAENPPCAFTAFATCPLPPKQNFLATAIEAGEKKYGTH